MKFGEDVAVREDLLVQVIYFVSSNIDSDVTRYYYINFVEAVRDIMGNYEFKSPPKYKVFKANEIFGLEITLKFKNDHVMFKQVAGSRLYSFQSCPSNKFFDENSDSCTVCPTKTISDDPVNGRCLNCTEFDEIPGLFNSFIAQ